MVDTSKITGVVYVCTTLTVNISMHAGKGLERGEQSDPKTTDKLEIVAKSQGRDRRIQAY